MDKDEELYREMNEEDDFYMGDRDEEEEDEDEEEEEEEPDSDDDLVVGCIWLVLMLTIIVTMVAC